MARSRCSRDKGSRRAAALARTTGSSRRRFPQSEGRTRLQLPSRTELRDDPSQTTIGDAMANPIMNLDDVQFDDIEDNGLYTSKRGQISDHIGARKLGYNLSVLPPGKAQCPFHCHHG